jgi:peptidoglycan/LPS O-acetylase OafA/YrhL
MKASFLKSSSIADVIRADLSCTTGFDYLRLGLSLVILIEHVLKLSIPGYDEQMPSSWFGPINRMELGMFFALSGFLVAGSLLRHDIPRFLTLRILRIVPALTVEVVMTALIIGVCFTTLPLSEYFRSPMFWSYFLNIVGDIHYTLPGVFNDASINLQLWTIPIEFECYFVLVTFSLLGFVRSGKTTGYMFFLITVLSASVSLTIFALWNNAVLVGPVMPGWALLLSFLCGVIGFLFKEQIPHHKYLFLICIAAAYGILKAPNLVFLAPLPIAYFTVYVGVLRPPRIPFGDLSYGIYLFHNPLLRTIYKLMGDAPQIPLLMLLTLLATGLFASMSWFWIEKPILLRKELWLQGVDRVCARFSLGARLPGGLGRRLRV